MVDIFRKGMTLVREDGNITLTPAEIRLIADTIDALDGQGSIDYWINTASDDEPEERVKAAEMMSEDILWCRNVWHEFLDDVFYDSGEMEYNAVERTLDSYIDFIKK